MQSTQSLGAGHRPVFPCPEKLYHEIIQCDMKRNNGKISITLSREEMNPFQEQIGDLRCLTWTYPRMV
eukprot:1142871-Pelagomonas_calceolata.AAC.3